VKGSSVPSSPSSRAPSPKDSEIPAKIEAAFREINKLSEEKCTLSQTLIDLVTRTRSRLDSDIARVRFLQGETPSYESALGTSYSAAIAGANGDLGAAGGRNPALQVTESLRNALAPSPSLPELRAVAVASAPSPAASASTTPANKRRCRLAIVSRFTNTYALKGAERAPILRSSCLRHQPKAAQLPLLLRLPFPLSALHQGWLARALLAKTLKTRKWRRIRQKKTQMQKTTGCTASVRSQVMAM
jgi:hypothetical protein